MADFEDKLNAILSDPESMAQIMQLAQSFASPPPEESTETQSADSGFFSALGGGMDPTLISKLLPLLQEYGKAQNGDTARLLSALQPFLKEERQGKIDKALQLARMIHLAKVFFKTEGGALNL